MTLAGLAAHLRVAIDSNVLIYLLEGNDRLGSAAAALIDGIAAGAREGVISTLAISEIATGPARAGDLAMVERYGDELSSLENVRVVPVDTEVALDAAVLRGAGGLTIADAIHLATARVAGASAFVTNDRRIVSLPRLVVLYLDELDEAGDP